jgi:hypothetical protein
MKDKDKFRAVNDIEIIDDNDYMSQLLANFFQLLSNNKFSQN